MMPMAGITLASTPDYGLPMALKAHLVDRLGDRFLVTLVLGGFNCSVRLLYFRIGETMSWNEFWQSWMGLVVLLG